MVMDLWLKFEWKFHRMWCIFWHIDKIWIGFQKPLHRKAISGHFKRHHREHIPQHNALSIFGRFWSSSPKYQQANISWYQVPNTSCHLTGHAETMGPSYQVIHVTNSPQILILPASAWLKKYTYNSNMSCLLMIKHLYTSISNWIIYS